MNIKKGLVVKAAAGKEKGNFFVVLNINGSYINICDGKYRPLEKTKRKNIKHLFLTTTILDENSIKTNKNIRKALKNFNENIKTR
ncbi:MAG: KOW domain-containing RNA-binding protein [Oscillospiraceae bacterium]|jgi:ribosomal protein L14E/L6E/L27E|nr:KOW domain-containing RNA-binding protein [Oscillospiraceae bacterium]